MRYDDSQWLDDMYNNRARVPEHPQYFEHWTRDSAFARSSRRCALDVAYGKGARERLDVFAASEPGSPVVVFIHGGYWRSLDKSQHSFIAPPLVDAGACVVMPNYELCPATTVPGIVMQMVKALAWTFAHAARHNGDPGRITVMGHSAGGQLAAMMMACDWKKFDPALPGELVTRALSISGVHDLEPLRHAPSLQGSLQLTPEDARRASPALLPAPEAGALYAVAGGAESMEFIRQSQLIRRAWGPERVPVCEALPGLNHFSIVEALVKPGHTLNRLALSLMRS
ncbi:MAG TPA: alpha/beta hydrolase [Ramlibacter sp.]|nr:alpha/beta hydrolase [Ramlibacter sp.]